MPGSKKSPVTIAYLQGVHDELEGLLSDYADLIRDMKEKNVPSVPSLNQAGVIKGLKSLGSLVGDCNDEFKEVLRKRLGAPVPGEDDAAAQPSVAAKAKKKKT